MKSMQVNTMASWQLPFINAKGKVIVGIIRPYMYLKIMTWLN